MDRLPAGNRGAVEHDAFAEGVFVDGRNVDRDVLPFAARVREAQIGVFYVVVLDQFHHVFSGRHGANTLSSAGRRVRRASGDAGSDGVQSGFAGSNPDCFFDVGDEDFAVADPPGLGGTTDRLDGFFDHVVSEHNLDLHLGKKIDIVFGSASMFGGPSLAATPL